MSGGNPGEGEAHGFSGLLSLVSHISDQAQAEDHNGPVKTTTTAFDPRDLKEELTGSAEPKARQDYPPSVPSTPSGSKKGWIIAALAVGVLIWVVVESNKQTYSPPYTPPPYSPPYTPSRPEPVPKPNPPQPLSPLGSQRTEDKPVPGDGTRSFTEGNIRWCVFQERKLEIIRSKIELSANQSDTSSFNAINMDYNNRCGRYRYREADMRQVQSELPLREADLRLQVEEMINDWPHRRQAPPLGRQPSMPYSSPILPPGSPVRTKATPPPLNPTVTSGLDLLRIEEATKVQRRLADLGFFIGTPDGIWSRKARQALREFKSDNGLPQDDAWDEPTSARLFEQNAQRKAAAATKGKQSNTPRGPDTDYAPPAGATMNPLNATDAIKLQNRLAELGFFAGRSDGVWGPASRSALREFKTRNGLTADDQWDGDTERAVVAEGAIREVFLGKWGDDQVDCQSAPIQISARDAKASSKGHAIECGRFGSWLCENEI
jgi:peptidoglycan hydrolase-like protein with peptidoglycan-binding domain